MFQGKTPHEEAEQKALSEKFQRDLENRTDEERKSDYVFWHSVNWRKNVGEKFFEIYD